MHYAHRKSLFLLTHAQTQGSTHEHIRHTINTLIQSIHLRFVPVACQSKPARQLISTAKPALTFQVQSVCVYIAPNCIKDSQRARTEMAMPQLLSLYLIYLYPSIFFTLSIHLFIYLCIFHPQVYWALGNNTTLTHQWDNETLAC